MDSELFSAGRLLAIHRFGGDELALADAERVLGAMTERTLERGTKLASLGTPLRAAWLLLEGRMHVTSGTVARRAEAGEAVGMVEMLARVPAGLDVECATDVVVLEVEDADLVAVMTESFTVLEAVIRILSVNILRASPFEYAHGQVGIRWPAPPRGYVERLLFLHELAAFVYGGAESLAEVAKVLEERRPPPGVLVHAGQPADEILIVVAGALRYGPSEVPAGAAFGWLHALGGVPLDHDVIAEPDTVLLTCSSDTMTELLEDDIGLAISWLRGAAQRVHELHSQ